MKRIVPLILAAALLLTGCSGWLDTSYHNMTPHEEETNLQEGEIVSVGNYRGLYDTLCGMVESGTESGIISVARYDQQLIEGDMAAAVEDVLATNAIAAYAVEGIRFELGTNAGQSAVAVNITYLHNRAEILKIAHLASGEELTAAVAQALDDCDSGIVVYVADYQDMDLDQWVSDYAAANPDQVMEVPEVTVNLYPDEGTDRVLEVKFTYQNSRESLRAMQKKVGDLFEAAAVYAGGDSDPQEQYFKLYSFLMGLFQTYQTDTSITPAYSLMQHGVGDSKAFATVYAALCVKNGLECATVTGTRAGEPRYWNMVRIDGAYYHVDVLECGETGEFVFRVDQEMAGYVWDYSAYSSNATEEASGE